MRSVKKWDIFEAVFNGPANGNPFVDVQLSAVFQTGAHKLYAEGFYDGGGLYRLRLMPDCEGVWNYTTSSNVSELDGLTGEFACIAAAPNAHGPVRTVGTRFAYSDGVDYQPVGTTCYVWNLQGDALEEQTLATLREAPFNKIRFCVFPKHYDFNHNDPERYPFEGSKADGWDFARFNPEYFQHLELRIGQLCELGIEADLIVFHPYDNGEWGFDTMNHEQSMRYVRYLTARLACYRNVWWSMANEYDLIPAKPLHDWDEYFRAFMTYDPAQHLRSVHNCVKFYDHTKKWVTHVSVQGHDMAKVSEYIAEYGKPIVVDECCYEGNITHDWGNLTGQEMVNRMWIGFARGAYVGHGETYMHPDDILWWSKGGVLHGESPARIQFLRQIFEALPAGSISMLKTRFGDRYDCGITVEEKFYLFYYDIRRQVRKRVSLPVGKQYRAEIIDAWNMTITPVPGTWSGNCELDMPGKPYCALRFILA